MHLARISIAAALVALAVPCAAAAQRGQMPAPEFIAAGPNLPFSQAVRVGRTIYLSGMLGMTAEGQLAAGGIEGETRQTLENIKAALQPLGATMDRLKTPFGAGTANWT